MNLDKNSKLNIESLMEDDPFMLGDDSISNFNQSEPNDFIELGGENDGQPELVRMMDCICPKCAEITKIDLALMPENGFVTSCSSCNKNMHVIKESCAGRAKRKSYEINCASCGKQLDQHAHCHSCGLIFPDYFITVNPEDARRQARIDFYRNKWAAIKELNFTITPIFDGHSQDDAPEYTPTSRSNSSVNGLANLFSRKFMVLAISLVVTIAFIATGVFTYNSYKYEQVYAENYLKTLYCIKTGVDSNLNACTSMKTEWESALASGRSFTPMISNNDETKSIRLRSEVDKLIQSFSNPPRKFALANDKLKNIYKIYVDTETLIISKPATWHDLDSSVADLNKKMSQASLDLKSNLPEALKRELEIARLKYRGMKDF